MVLQVYAIKRSGSLSQLNYSVSVDKSAADKLQVAGLLSDGNYNAVDKQGDAADGIELMDAKNAKLYQVASNGSGECLCSRDLNSAFIDPGQTMLFSATFAAPPADVQNVDVKVPKFGTVSGVAVR